MSAPPAFRALPLGAVRPRGWMAAQMRRDLASGFAGRLDALTGRAATDLFRGRIPSTGDPRAWWDAETRGNWMWGYLMMAHLAGDAGHRARADRLAETLRATQDADGYLGIYAPEARYRHGASENGELWAQGRALMVLLAHHELTGDAASLAAARAAADLTAARYGPGRPYFALPAEPGMLSGMTHGLCFVDVLERLHALTGDTRYRDFGRRLYDGFTAMPVPFPNDDLAAANLLDSARPLRGHAVHTVEQLRALVLGLPGTAELLDAALAKLRRYATPSGAVIGDEALRDAPTPDIGYEYCTLTELLFSLTVALERTGDAALGDWTETLCCSAAQGARAADGRAVSYLTPDTRLAATADRPDAYTALEGTRGRFKLSPTHEDVACCCSPNATRLLAHYVQRMWLALAEPAGLAAALYGPSAVAATVAGVRVAVTEETAYPFEDTVRFTVSPERPLTFALALRRPAWAAAMEVDGGTVREVGGFALVERRWEPGDVVTVRFTVPVTLVPYAEGGHAVRRGPLQFVEPVAHVERAIRDHPVPGFHDTELTPADPAAPGSAPVLDASRPGGGLAVERVAGADLDHPWDAAPVRLRDGGSVLVPLGCAPLRRAAFTLG